jgi:hypothetical protein
MLEIRFAVIVIQLQMKRIQVSGTRKSIPNKEFGNYAESQSIEVRNTGMLLIRFALIVIQLQMRQIQAIRTRKSSTNQELQHHAE